MEHFPGITPQERYQNDLLNEMRQIRVLLERNAQAVEQPKIRQAKPAKPVQRQKRKGVVNL